MHAPKHSVHLVSSQPAPPGQQHPFHHSSHRKCIQPFSKLSATKFHQSWHPSQHVGYSLDPNITTVGLETYCQKYIICTPSFQQPFSYLMVKQRRHQHKKFLFWKKKKNTTYWLVITENPASQTKNPFSWLGTVSWLDFASAVWRNFLAHFSLYCPWSDLWDASSCPLLSLAMSELCFEALFFLVEGGYGYKKCFKYLSPSPFLRLNFFDATFPSKIM